MSTLTRQTGLTLVELLIATTITAILFSGMALFTANYLQTSTIERARSELLADNIAVLDQISEDIRQASGADAANRYADPFAPGANDYSWVSSESGLVLATIALDASSNVIYEDAAQYLPAVDNVVYFVEDTTLYRRTLAGSIAGDTAQTTCPVSETGCPHDRTLSKNVSEFSLRYLDENDTEVSPDEARSVEITLGLAVSKYGQQITTQYTTRTVFRNS